jgi:predicted nucleic acid-binding protein
MIVVADTSPINYLVLIEQQEILPELFGRVIIPQAVFEELQRDGTPPLVREWVSSSPKWLEVHQSPAIEDASLTKLHAGEREAILLIEQMHGDLLIMDERKGRRIAASRNIAVLGTVGILEQAALRGLIDLPETLARLKETSIRVPDELIQALIEQYKKK